MFKKIMVLGAAIAALVAIAAPAAHAEVTWTTDGTAIATHDIVTFSGAGNAELTSKVWGWHKQVVAILTLKPGTLKVGDYVVLSLSSTSATAQAEGRLAACPAQRHPQR